MIEEKDRKEKELVYEMKRKKKETKKKGGRKETRE